MIVLYQDPKGTSVFRSETIHAVSKVKVEDEVTVASLRQKIEDLEKRLTYTVNNTEVISVNNATNFCLPK